MRRRQIIPKLLVVLLLLAAGCCGCSSSDPAEGLLVCGWDEVFLIDAGAAARGKAVDKLWSWRARNSPGMPQDMVRHFGTTDDCKPIEGGAKMLITSSGGACALVERRTGRTLWHARVPNAHSIELLPGGRAIVASSTSASGNKLMLFDLADGQKVLWEAPLVSAHGVVWDAQRQTLYALGLKELRAYALKDWEGQRPALELKREFELPDGDGHDLQPVSGSSDLVLTTGRHVYLFDRDRAVFRLHPVLGNLEHVKCVTIHPRTGRALFIQADPKQWWSRTLHLLDPPGRIELPDEKMYKGRWL